MSGEGKTPNQPNLADLMAGYLQRRTDAQQAGLVSSDSVGEVTPFDAAPVQTVDPRVAWNDALAAVDFFQPRREGQ